MAREAKVVGWIIVDDTKEYVWMSEDDDEIVLDCTNVKDGAIGLDWICADDAKFVLNCIRDDEGTIVTDWICDDESRVVLDCIITDVETEVDWMSVDDTNKVGWLILDDWIWDDVARIVPDWTDEDIALSVEVVGWMDVDRAEDGRESELDPYTLLEIIVTVGWVRVDDVNTESDELGKEAIVELDAVIDEIWMLFVWIDETEVDDTIFEDDKKFVVGKLDDNETTCEELAVTNEVVVEIELLWAFELEYEMLIGVEAE